ncbi:MAG: DNA polymerase III subunit epsilon [Georgfuchsia sp.]
MTRKIFLDTETTGLEYQLGDRIIEVACVEMLGRRQTGRHFHRYVNPQRDIEAGAQAVHGLTREFLADKPLFATIADELCEFIDGAELIIHNAPFDIGFLNHEFALLKREPVETLSAGVVDTLRMARDLRPGKKNSLDALCSEFAIDNSSRQLHGALLDAELLAEVYLAMTRGQDSLMMELELPSGGAFAGMADRPPVQVLRASAEELADHARVLQEIAEESKGNCLWAALDLTG